MTRIAVLDIGKTNLKVALVDLEQMSEIAVETAPNVVIGGPPWPHYDTTAQRQFLFGALARLSGSHRIDGIAVTTHGACACLLGQDGHLIAPVMDYEFSGPDHLRADYDRLRPLFDETGSPALPMGLNLGAQLHYMLATDPTLLDRLAHLVTWPQYWGYLLTGNVASDVSSLGCHTDLWNPYKNTWSSLIARLGLTEKMAPARRPDEILGYVTPRMQLELGLPAIPVVVGIHDSNASLLPHLLDQRAPFSVVSTGTWVISMAIGGMASPLRPERDTLINVNSLGDAVPSARFMGGREFSMMMGEDKAQPTKEDEETVVDRSIMLLPSVVPESGPFQGRPHQWTSVPESQGQKCAALGFYLALMTAECLRMIGSQGYTLVEGPFARNTQFLSMLATATNRDVVVSAARTGTALGAARLFSGKPPKLQSGQIIRPDPLLDSYAKAWRKLVG